MCGIFGDVTRHGSSPSIGVEEAQRLRDDMSYRGPDDAGIWAHENVLLGHRRLAIRALGAPGAQPRVSADGRWAIVFDGELYEDEELRDALAGEGRPVREPGDAATVLEAFRAWGPDAIEAFRGMFAIAAVDLRERRLWLARDPFGMKPLYWWADEDEVVFASTPAAVLGHPRVPVLPDLGMISAYLSTLRNQLEDRTLFEGLRALEPGQVLEFDFDATTRRPLSAPRSSVVGCPRRGVRPGMSMDEAVAQLRATLGESVRRHLVADVPVASLLSGGLDSTVIAALARGHVAAIPTYGAGTRGAEPGDLEFARSAAGELGLPHHQVELDGTSFEAGWREPVDRTGLPLSTPNEVAILAVCRALRADGNVVALSGEGADEILGGYEGVLRAARGFEERSETPLDGGRFHLEIGAWIGPAGQHEVLRPEVHAMVDDDAFVIAAYRRAFERARAETPPDADPLDAHLRFQRQTNLAGLLGRLDTASMVAGVEGRTPFADRDVVSLAESLPFALKYGAETSPTGAGIAVATRTRGKLVLRRAFAHDVPAAILDRPKASFPLPFQEWLEAGARDAAASPFAEAVFQPHMLALVTREPREHWTYAWPMFNIARWGDRWWG